MRRILISLLLALGLSLSSMAPATAGPMEDGQAAFQVGDYATALRLFKQEAEQGDGFAQALVGAMYVDGQGVPQDYVEAVKWFRLAAEQGYADAQSNLGYMYFNGQGVPQDYVLAHMWFNLSASQGSSGAASRRDIAASRMTPAQIAEAQQLAREWHPK